MRLKIDFEPEKETKSTCFKTLGNKKQQNQRERTNTKIKVRAQLTVKCKRGTSNRLTHRL